MKQGTLFYDRESGRYNFHYIDEDGDRLSDGELRETQMTNYFSNLYPIDCAVLSVNAQSYRKYGTLPEHEFLPEI